MGLSLLSPAQVHVHTHKTNTDMHRERGKKNPTKPSLARIVLIKKKKKKSTRTIKKLPTLV